MMIKMKFVQTFLMIREVEIFLLQSHLKFNNHNNNNHHHLNNFNNNFNNKVSNNLNNNKNSKRKNQLKMLILIMYY